MNVDGSVLGVPGHSGRDMVIRNSDGMLVAACSIYFEVDSCCRATLMALLHALGFFLQQGFSHFVLKMDSKLLVDMLSAYAHWQ